MADAPWIKWFTSDFLNGVADLEADEIGIYAVMLTLQADRGAPIEDDPKWLARRCGTSTRRFNQVRARLLALGKLEARAGMLGNRRMMTEVTKRDGKSAQARTAALSRWHREGEPELPLDDDDQDAQTEPPPRARTHGQTPDRKIKSGKTGGKAQEQNHLISGKSDRKRENSAENVDADACPPVRARRVQKLEDSDSTLPDSESRNREAEAGEPPPPDRLNDADLKDKVDAICEAAGYRPISPGQIDRAYRIVQEWIREDLDFDQVVIPTIRAVVADSRDPTRTLGRFSARIRHEQARLKAQGTVGRSYVAPPSPVLDFDDEDPQMRTIRADILERLGPQSYSLHANHVRLRPETDVPGYPERAPLRVEDRTAARHASDLTGTVRPIAMRHGFTEVW